MNELVAGIVIANPELRQAVVGCLRDMLVRVTIDEAGFGHLPALVERIGLVRPDVMIVELAGLGEATEETLAALKSGEVSPALIIVDSVAQPNLIIAAMRAGAIEYLYPPLESRLHAALQKVWLEIGGQSPVRNAGKALGFLSAKGGCGATTIACHLAFEFQRQTDLRILLADLDVDSGMIRFLLKTDSPYSVLDAVTNVHRLDSSFWKALVSNGTPRLEVITAPARAPAEPPPEVPFRHVLRFTKSIYELVLVDLGRGLTPLNLSLLRDIDECYLVTTLDVPALYRTKELIQTLQEGGYGKNRVRLIVNRMHKAADVSLGDLERTLGVTAYGVVPNDYAALDEAYSAGKLAAPGGILGVHYARLAAKMAGLTPVAAPPRRRFISLF